MLEECLWLNMALLVWGFDFMRDWFLLGKCSLTSRYYVLITVKDLFSAPYFPLSRNLWYYLEFLWNDCHCKLQGLQGVTKGYGGLQGVTGGYKGLGGLHEVTGVTGGYKGLPGVTRGNGGLQGVMGGYKGLQKVTRGYGGLQGVTGGYNGLQGITGGYKG